jgi:predicted TIM-barrel fold metal-dependent hydrolase
MMMKIVDAHVHLIEFMSGFNRRGEMRPLGKGRARWASGEETALIPEELGDYSFTGEAMLKLMDENGVEKAVLMQGNQSGYQNEYCYEMMKKYPDRFAASCTFDPFALQAEKIMRRFFHEMRFPIVKFEVGTDCGLMSYHRAFDLDGDMMRPIYEEIARLNQVLVVDIGRFNDASHQPDAFYKIAKRHPEMKIVLCHILLPSKGDENLLEEQLGKLKLDNIWFDLAALPLLLQGEEDPIELSRGFIRIARKVVGAEKLIWGSDSPSTMAFNTYRELIDYIAKSDIFTDSELEGVFYKNACAVYPFGKA